MKSQYKISIPEPCHEDWNKMTPIEKGRFCSSCSKTVVDFTQKSATEIQQYLTENKGEIVCGHFYRKQLDSIVLQIPETTFHQQLSFQNLFILALLFIMGTTLFSCKVDNGKNQKIEKVELIDTVIKTKNNKWNKVNLPKRKVITNGLPIIGKSELSEDQIEETIIETSGEIDELTEPFDINKLNISEEEEDIIEGEITVGYVIQEASRFKESKDFSEAKAKKYFNSNLKKIFRENFKAPQGDLGLKQGKQKSYIQFEIDTLGRISNIKIKSPHLAIEKEILKVLKKIPKLIPAKKRGKPVKSIYTLPLILDVE